LERVLFPGHFPYTMPYPAIGVNGFGAPGGGSLNGSLGFPSHITGEGH
jgi:hypothetical protein